MLEKQTYKFDQRVTRYLVLLQKAFFCGANAVEGVATSYLKFKGGGGLCGGLVLKLHK